MSGNVVNIPLKYATSLDRKDIIFKRPPEADIALKLDGGKAVTEIRCSTPHAPAKLQLEDDPEEIDDWRQLVETVLIDPNYDGEVLKPGSRYSRQEGYGIWVYELLTDLGRKLPLRLWMWSEEYFEVLEVGAR